MNLNLNARFKDTHMGNKGFTLVELLIVVAIMAIVLAVAVPDFISATRVMQSKHQAKELSGAIKFAQSEAIRRRQKIVICRKNLASDTCKTNAPARDWRNGWIVFVDNSNNNSNIFDGSDILLSIKQPLTQGYVAIANASAIGNNIDFNAAGESIANMGTINFYHENNPTAIVELKLSFAGRVSIITP